MQAAVGANEQRGALQTSEGAFGDSVSPPGMLRCFLHVKSTSVFCVSQSQ